MSRGASHALIELGCHCLRVPDDTHQLYRLIGLLCCRWTKEQAAINKLWWNNSPNAAGMQVLVDNLRKVECSDEFIETQLSNWYDGADDAHIPQVAFTAL